MLIDARHPEETRVAVIRGNRIEEFDFEAAEKKQLKGNIYLAKVTRVEPSLQAAFVEYGGNRHGFLPFSEIHPDYYQIPTQDREELIRLEHEAASTPIEEPAEPAAAEGGEGSETTESGGGDDDAAQEALRRRRHALRRKYKVQEVIKRRQILLVQVVKEERGGKGAALTTYLSLAGRYSVLMPNTSGGGGISRKISNQSDRRQLKSIMADLKLPAGMGCIIRTAGLKRTKTEIKRDFDYLTRLWDDIRELTLSSTAPALIHEDSNLIKRAIRDVYNRDIDQIEVEGEAGYRAAKDFMRLLMPSHAKKVQLYRESVPLFAHYQVESQLETMYRPVVTLKSGGYIVLNQTEALVAIDINSGRSTREHNIEETALKTNLEAADEIARQLRLRDLAGLVVIDFIDMEEKNSIRQVERRIKDALKNDRARIQLGRISGFGLFEMSRQRLRTGVLEASTHSCPTCAGAGIVRTVPSSALHVLRSIEDEAARGRASALTIKLAADVAFYLLNNKRRELNDIEARYGVSVTMVPDGGKLGAEHDIERSGAPPVQVARPAPPAPMIEDDVDDDVVDEDEDEAGDDAAADDTAADDVRDADAGEPEERNRRRRRRRRRRKPGGEPGEAGASEASEQAPSERQADGAAPEGEDGERGERRRRRRGRRGGRGRDQAPGDRGQAEAALVAESDTGITDDDGPADNAEAASGAETAGLDAGAPPVTADPVQAAAEPGERPAEPEEAAPAAKPAKARRPRASRSKAKAAAAAEPAEGEAAAEPDAAATPAPVAVVEPDAPTFETHPVSTGTPVLTGTPEPAAMVEPDTGTSALPAAAAADEPAEPSAPPRRGWWNRTFGG